MNSADALDLNLINNLTYFSGIIGLVALITFFVMAAALHNISKRMKNIEDFIMEWGYEKGYGKEYICDTCKTHFNGKKSKCPFCGAPLEY